jgi:hypothetical protein
MKTEEVAQNSESVFPKGEKLESENFTGTVWLQMMGARDTTLHARFGNVTFAPKPAPTGTRIREDNCFL